MKTPEVYRNLISESERKELVEYLRTEGDRRDARPDITSKHPLWNQSVWPQHIVQKALDKIFPNGYIVDEVTFMDSNIGLKPHTDWIGGFKTVLFALDADPVAHTVFFNNFVRQRPFESAFAVFLTRKKWTPFQYTMTNKHGEPTYVEDIKDLLEQCKNNPESVTDFNPTPEFIQDLEALIVKRSMPQLKHKDQTDQTGYTQVTPRISDYSCVENYDENLMFDEELHKQYLNHIAIEDLHGLTFDQAVEWNLGDVIAFDSEQVHSASSTHSNKKFITVFLH